MTTVTIAVGNTWLAAEEKGNGTGVVFLHAGVADRRMWASAMQSLSAGYHCISYDRRGFGQTVSSDETFRHIDDLDAVVAHFGGGACHVIGCSQGGRIAIDFALARPEKVLSLVLVTTALSGEPAPTHYPTAVQHLLDDLEQAEAAADIDRINAIEARLWLDGPEQPEGRVAGSNRNLFLDMNDKALRHRPVTGEQRPESAVDRLSSITCPSLVVWGTLDFPHIRQRSRYVAAAIPGARTFEMAGCAHLPNLEQPGKFEAEVVRFLDGQSPPRT